MPTELTVDRDFFLQQELPGNAGTGMPVGQKANAILIAEVRKRAA
jgi:hypothetical protein